MNLNPYSDIDLWFQQYAIEWLEEWHPTTNIPKSLCLELMVTERLE